MANVINFEDEIDKRMKVQLQKLIGLNRLYFSRRYVTDWMISKQTSDVEARATWLNQLSDINLYTVFTAMLIRPYAIDRDDNGEIKYDNYCEELRVMMAEAY